MKPVPERAQDEAVTREVAPALPEQPLPTYTIQKDDTLGAIAAKRLGSAAAWREIVQMNPGLDPLRLRAGTAITLPRRAAAPARSEMARPVQNPPAGSRVHVVARDDTLAAIARRYYDDWKGWEAIYAANRAAIGSDPGKLELGMNLVIPSR